MSLFFRWNLVPLIIASKALIISQVHSAQEGEPVDFARKILPILSNKCFACHGPDSKKPSQLRLDSFAAATADRDGVRAITMGRARARATACGCRSLLGSRHLNSRDNLVYKIQFIPPK